MLGHCRLERQRIAPGRKTACATNGGTVSPRVVHIIMSWRIIGRAREDYHNLVDLQVASKPSSACMCTSSHHAQAEAMLSTSTCINDWMLSSEKLPVCPVSLEHSELSISGAAVCRSTCTELELGRKHT